MLEKDRRSTWKDYSFRPQLQALETVSPLVSMFYRKTSQKSKRMQMPNKTKSQCKNSTNVCNKSLFDYTFGRFDGPQKTLAAAEVGRDDVL